MRAARASVIPEPSSKNLSIAGRLRDGILWETSVMTQDITPLAVTIRPATEADLPAINAIYNREILEGVATWDTEPWSKTQRLDWLQEHRRPGTLAIVADLPEVPVAGFAYLSYYKTRLGYRFTREDVLYVRPEFHRRGVGRSLLAALLDEARRFDIHVVLARIEATNEESIALHRALGFEIVGEEREAGHKFGMWRSLTVMQITLDDRGRG